ncbi:MAG: Kae1-associated serine/threonine protein kinase [Candidatus Marsarchaeota archaeon]|jgi:TP53 regulating kinase-like protein|nr:Kae1-associated serine/threonine protein kinase [Candidatus Marsarchaeota archaeon]
MALKKISEGAEADIYELDFLGVPSIMKFRRRKSYLVPEIEESLRFVRTKTEARILAKASSITNAPRPLFVSKYGIIMEKLQGIRASEMHSLGSESASRAASILASLHGAGIVHGDFTKANLLAYENRLYVIDFGLSFYSSSAEDMAFDVLLIKRSISKDEYASFRAEYAKSFDKAKEVLKKLDGIERRGRYQNRSLDAK